jgi:hypothetical protein
VIAVVASIAAMAALAGCTPPKSPGAAAKALKQVVTVTPKSTVVPPNTPSCHQPRAGGYVGISVSGYPQRPALLNSTIQAFGINPNVISLYYVFGRQISSTEIASLCASGRFPLVEIDTNKMPLQSIVNGSQDAILRSYATQFGTTQVPIAIDFNHEFNGPWFDWGYKHATAPVFVAAWRHMVTVFRQNGATNVLWIWNPNVNGKATVTDLQAWYPGDAYVNWIGLDGYFYNPGDTFESIFNPTLNQIRQFTKLPWLIVETGANPTSQRVRAINSIFAGVQHAEGLLGLIWFDYNAYSGHDWKIDQDPAALAAFRSGVISYQRLAGH